MKDITNIFDIKNKNLYSSGSKKKISSLASFGTVSSKSSESKSNTNGDLEYSKRLHNALVDSLVTNENLNKIIETKDKIIEKLKEELAEAYEVVEELSQLQEVNFYRSIVKKIMWKI